MLVGDLVPWLYEDLAGILPRTRTTPASTTS